LWSDEVLKFLYFYCLGNVQVRIEDRRLKRIHDSTVQQFQDDNFETLVDCSIPHTEFGTWICPPMYIETDS